MRIGCIGQGFVGKSYADDFEARGFDVVRYSLEEPYVSNKELIQACDIVFIAVPTPTTPAGSDISIIREALDLVGTGATAVIKSTTLPGTTRELAEQYSDRFVLHSPEFLSKATARADVEKPKRNIIGIPFETDAYRERAEAVVAILPQAPYTLICASDESEFLKYVNNTFFYTKVVYMNILHDMAEKLGITWSRLRDAIAAEPWIGDMHIDPVHKSGRGSGGACMIKDFAAFAQLYRELCVLDEEGLRLVDALEQKNLKLLRDSGKDASHIRDVYGDSI